MATLPFIDDFSTETTNPGWAANSIPINTFYNGRYYAAIDGIYRAFLLNLSQFSRVTDHDTYTILLRSGPTGFITNTLNYFTVIIPLKNDVDNTSDSIYIEQIDGTSFTLGDQNMVLTSSSPESAITITIEYTTAPVATLKYFDSGDISLVPDQTISYTHLPEYTNLWSGNLLVSTGVSPATDTVFTFFGLYTGTGPCFAHDSLIETVAGLKKVQDLTTDDVVVGFDETLTRVVNVWQTQEKMLKECYTIGSILVTGDHNIASGDTWQTVESMVHQTPKFIEAYFYQIETTGYGIKTSGYIFSTITVTDSKERLRPML